MITLEALRRSGATVLALIAAGSLAAPVRGATCGPGPDSIAAADVVFIGTLDVANAGGNATFAVDEVWKGGSMPAAVEVTGSGGQWSGQVRGTQYLVLATVVGSILQVDSECNGAYPWDPSLAALRPATAHPPQSSPTSEGIPLQVFLIAGIVAVLAVVSFFAFGSTRTRAG